MSALTIAWIIWGLSGLVLLYATFRRQESHNATPKQNKTALDAENHNETDS